MDKEKMFSDFLRSLLETDGEDEVTGIFPDGLTDEEDSGPEDPEETVAESEDMESEEEDVEEDTDEEVEHDDDN